MGGVGLTGEGEELIGSVFDDVERLMLVVDIRLWLSGNENCFMKDDDEIERRWLPILLNGLEPYLIRKKKNYIREEYVLKLTV